MSEHDTTKAADDLARAEMLDSAVRSSSRWYVRYQVGFGLATGALPVAIGLVGGNLVGAEAAAAILTATGVYFVVVAVLIVYAVRQPVIRRGLGARYTVMVLLSMFLYDATVVVGATQFPDNLAWWLAGGVTSALPGLVGAIVETR